MSFLDFCFSSNWERERERERERESGIYKIWVYRKNSPKVTYLIFRRGSTGESFFFHGLIDLILFFYAGLKNLGSLVSQIFFFLQPGILALVRLPATNPAKQLTFLLVFFADGEKGATSVLGPQPIIWLLPSPPGQAILLGLLDVTQVRLLLIQTAVIPLPSSQWDITWHPPT